MTQIILTATITFTLLTGYSQKQDTTKLNIGSSISIPIDVAKNYIGKTVNITSRVYRTRETGKVAFTNVGGRYTNAPLTLFIRTAYLKNFKDKPNVSIDGNEITVVGSLKTHNIKPQTFLHSS